MALAATQVWEVRTTGSDNNGGGFNSAAAGTDYSQQDAAQYAFTDLAVDAVTNTKVQSASHNFVAADVGNLIQITAGAGWTTGFYEILSVASNQATLDRSPGAVGITSGTWALGGALATPGKACSAMVAGNKLYIKTGTYTITSSTSNVASGRLSPPAGTSATVVTNLVGYGVARDDYAGNRPVIQSSGASAVTLLTLGALSRAAYLEIDGNSGTTIQGVSIGANSTLYHSKIRRCTNGATNQTAVSSLCIRCEATANNVGFQGGQCFNCTAYSNTGSGFATAIAGTVWAFCLSAGNTGASSRGFIQSGNVTSTALHCTAYGNGGDGFRFAPGATSMSRCINCLAVNNGGYGFSVAATTNDEVRLYNCAHYNNTSGGVEAQLDANHQIGTVALTADPFNNAAGNDYSLNSASGGGALLRSVGFQPFEGLSTTGYADIGAVQHPNPTRGSVGLTL